MASEPVKSNCAKNAQNLQPYYGLPLEHALVFMVQNPESYAAQTYEITNRGQGSAIAPPKLEGQTLILLIDQPPSFTDVGFSKAILQNAYCS